MKVKIEKTISLGVLIQTFVIIISTILLISKLDKSQENDLLIAKRVVGVLDNIESYLAYNDDFNDKMKSEISDVNSKLSDIEKHLDKIGQSIGSVSYVDKTIVESLNYISKEIE